MPNQYFDFGLDRNVQDPASLKFDYSKYLYFALKRHPDFELFELRTKDECDVIVVDCADGTVPSCNTVGIKGRERLAIVCGYPSAAMIEVRALRKGFPCTAHQNHVLSNEPPSLCLFFEPWQQLERNWTAERFLFRILWWMRETANGTLHRRDQPLEQLYFDSPYQFILPPNFLEANFVDESALQLTPVWHPDRHYPLVRGTFLSKSAGANNVEFAVDCLVLMLAPVQHGRVEKFPSSLGQLHDQLGNRGSDFISLLNEKISSLAESCGINYRRQDRKILLLLKIPLRREQTIAPEKTEIKSFHLDLSLTQLGVQTGALTVRSDFRAYPDQSNLGASSWIVDAANLEWRAIPVIPVDVRFALSKRDARQASGLAAAGQDFNGVLAGAGALGSVLAELWSRSGWGNWTIIDDDIVSAHNLARHTAKDVHIGRPKVDVVAELIKANYVEGHECVTPIRATVNNSENPLVKQSIEAATLLIDATTTLEAPRDLSELNWVPRSATIFLTPSGDGSVLILEDQDQTIRLSSIEPQYYRAILNSTWGTDHLKTEHKGMWVGAGCRDISAVLSNELIQKHGAILSRQIRRLTAEPKAAIRIWLHCDEDDSIQTMSIPVEKSATHSCSQWRVTLDDGLLRTLHTMRVRALPLETGGILVGYFDVKIRTLFVVDAFPAPKDSLATETEFTRGSDGLNEILTNCAKKTANIVCYVGEWHSHPDSSSTQPSSFDNVLADYLGEEMKHEGLPALMLIVGETGISINLNDHTDQ